MYIKRCVKYLIEIGVLYIVSLVSFNNLVLPFREEIIRNRELKRPINFIKNERKGFKLLDSLETEGIQVNFGEDSQSTKNQGVVGYNRHPNFCLGNYTIFDIEILKDFLKVPEEFRAHLLSYLSLMTKLRFRLLEYGSLMATHRDIVPGDKIKGTKLKTFDDFFFANTLGNDFTDSSLSLIKRMFDQTIDNERDEEFMSRIIQEEIQTFEVKDLISDIPWNNGSREDLMYFMEKEVLGSVNPPPPLSVIPSNWTYNAPLKQVEMTMFLKDIDYTLKIKFPLFPGTKPFVIDSGSLVLIPSQRKNPYSGETKNKPVRLAEVKVRPYKYRTTHRPIQPCPENEKNMFICIDGIMREKYNLLFKLLETLSSNLRAPDGLGKPGAEQKLLHKLDDHRPLNVKLIHVNLNSKLELLIPLLTYVDLENGKSHLCHPGIPIEANPDRVWSIHENSYSMYNYRFIPHQYRNAGFFSSQNLRFRDKDVLKLLSQYLDFKKLLYNSDPEGPPPLGSPLWNEDLKFRIIQSPQKIPVSTNTLENSELSDNRNGYSSKVPHSHNDFYGDNRVNIYCINGNRRMIYKNESSAIFVNLLV